MIKSKYKTYSFLVIWFLLSTVAGFRPVGLTRDMGNYIEDVITYSGIKSIDFSVREPLNYLILEFVRLFLSSSYRGYFIICAFIGVGLKLRFIYKNSLFSTLSILFYLAHSFVLHDMTQVRAGIGIGLFLLATPYLAEKNVYKYFFLILIGSLFHYSIILLFPMYLINSERINKKKYLFFLVISFLVYHFGLLKGILYSIMGYIPSFLSFKISYYLLNEQFSINPFNLKMISSILVAIFLIIHSEKFKEKKDILFLKIYTISICCFYIFSDIPAFAHRLSELFGVVIIVILPHTVKIFKQKKIIYFFILLYGLIIFYDTYFIQKLIYL